MKKSTGTVRRSALCFCRSSTIRVLGCVALSAFLITTAKGAVENSIVKVALTGEQAPGLPAGVVLIDITRSFSTGVSGPLLSNGGYVAFRGTVEGPGINSSNRTSIWAGRLGALQLLAREGDPAPGGGTFGSISMCYYVVNGLGEVAFRGTDHADNDVVWRGTPGHLREVVRSGDVLAGTSGGRFERADMFRLNDTGQLSMRAFTNHPTYSYGIFFDSSSGLQAVAVVGGPIPDSPEGTLYSCHGLNLNASGAVSFRSTIGRPDGSGGYALFAGIPGGIHLVACKGDEAVGIATEGVAFLDFSKPKMNAVGEVAFNSWLSGPGIDTGNDSGIWVETGGTLALRVREGNDAPGTGASFGHFGYWEHPVIDNQGRVAFKTELTGAEVSDDNDMSIWAERDGLQLVAREGDQAPGTESGTCFQGFHDDWLFNGLGKIAFLAQLCGPDVTEHNDAGIWRWVNGQLDLVVREGDQLEVNPGDFRTIASVYGTAQLFGPRTNLANEPTNFNDAGDLLIWMEFTDDSHGVFYAPIPEPTVLALVFTGLAMIGLISCRSPSDTRRHFKTVILSEAKDLPPAKAEILRCAQNDNNQSTGLEMSSRRRLRWG